VLEIGEEEKAWKLRRWIEAQADEQGWLPEQLAFKVNNETMVAPWIEKWGPSATPLLWSHAEYLILCKVMQGDE
jgi:GH15 family glucan-1,4-alpha-glucosidase